ncbi:MAG: acyl-CoA dehydrogenase [Pontixanthobacter sp.]
MTPLVQTAFARRHMKMVEAIGANAASQDHDDGNLHADIVMLHAAGWLSACLPTALGGKGWGCEWTGLPDAIAALRLMGYANLATARLFEGHMNAVKLIALHAPSATAERIAREVAGGALLGVWGADRPDHRVVVEPAGDSFVLQGHKQFASGLGVVSHAVITAATPGEAGATQLILAPVGDPAASDPTPWRMAGMQATRSGHYRFDGLRVTRDDFLGAPDVYFREPFFEGGIWRYCAAHAGGAEALYDAWQHHLVERNRINDPIQRSRLIDAMKAIGTANLWVDHAARSVEHPDALDADNAANGVATALIAREMTEVGCLAVIALAEKALGMAAHMHGSPIERIRRDLRLYLCQAAPDAKHHRIGDTLLDNGGSSADESDDA